MKICITSCGKTLDAAVESRFGRSPYFIIWNTENQNFEVLENSSVNEASGVGIKAAQQMIDKGVNVVLTGQVGPKAMQVLGNTSIQVIEGVSGSVTEAIDHYLANDIAQTKVPLQINDVRPNLFQRIGRCFGYGRGRHGMGNCICTKCGTVIPHHRGIPCRAMSCPQCGAPMIRE